MRLVTLFCQQPADPISSGMMNVALLDRRKGATMSTAARERGEKRNDSLSHESENRM